MIKRNLITALLALTSFAAAHADKVVLINGNPAQKDAATLNFDGNKAIVNYTDGSSFTYDMEEVVVKFTQSTGAVNNNAAAFLKLNTIVKDVINIEGASEGDVVRISDAKGVVLYYTTAQSENVTIDASPLSSGVYMLTVGNQSVKFVKE